MRVDSETAIIGYLFKRGPPSRRVMEFSPDEAERLSKSGGRSLLREYWGGYVMIRADVSGTVSILRDPSGALPCYFRREADHILFAGSIADLAEPGPGVADLEEIARIAASGDARGRRTCVSGIDELIAGECLVVGRDGVAIEPWWTPWDHVEQTASADFAEAAVRLRETISDCVGSWASCFPSILLGSSGGLDSSIVAVASAPRARRLACLTLVGPDFGGDEQRYAAALAASLGLGLEAVPMDLEDIDVGRAVAPHQPWPIAPLFKQSVEAIHMRMNARSPIDAHFTGNGGDGMLCSIRSAVPLLDRFLAEGPRPALAETLRDICILTGTDSRTVLRHAWARYRRDGGRHHVRFDFSGISPDAASRIETAGGTHPWLSAPTEVLPGKTVHAAYLMRTQKGIELYPRSCSPIHVAPLVSQPIAELCLSIPSWLWIEGGRNRAVAREAFEHSFPELVARRTQKGGPGGFQLSIYHRFRAILHDRLRGGLLTSAGIFDTALLDEPDDPSWRGTERLQRILALAAAENWARWWSGSS
ncbi:asparagine synthase-related protein [Sphingopyxis sp.]|uniref:asparagine synthase-related protein n=1 Tax=Sphingopyxis sp. TaxID=1908224 RepID=UPI002D78A965|nr:asparagine synthase-related protein [Sphingopyxis sp.]HET6523516.1 asparagine synthase-related protein [Sphingopyxis sp.]